MTEQYRQFTNYNDLNNFLGQQQHPCYKIGVFIGESIIGEKDAEKKVYNFTITDSENNKSTIQIGNTGIYEVRILPNYITNFVSDTLTSDINYYIDVYY